MSEDSSSMSKQDKKSFIPALQGLRGVSALSVFAVHTYLIGAHQNILGPIALWHQSIIDTLGQGVLLFFMISGYLIPQSLARHRDAAAFLFDRAIRIFPVYVVIHLIVFVIGPFIGYKFFETSSVGDYVLLFLANLLMVAPLLHLPLAQQNSWTLTYEWLFYILAALAFLSSRRWSRGAGIAVIASIAIVSVVLKPVCLFFVIGSAYAWLGGTLRMAPWRGAALTIAALIAMYVCAQYVNYWAAGVFGLIVFGVALDRESAFARLLTTKPLQYLGLISYSFYLLHPVILLGAAIALHRATGYIKPGFASVTVFVIAGFLISTVGAFASYELLEKRVRGLLHQRLAPVKTRVATGVRYKAGGGRTLRPSPKEV